MNSIPATVYQQRNNVSSLVTLSMVVLLCLQVWLLIEVIQTSLGGEGSFSLLATFLSILCVAGNWQLWGLLHRRIDTINR